MGTLYNNKNIGAAFVLMGSILLIMVVGELAIKFLFMFLALMCIDHGLRLMEQESLIKMIRRWLNSL